MTKTFDSWIGAVLVLRDEPCGLHYKEIATRVVDSGLTTLGRKGYTPASQTMGSILRTTTWAGEHVFGHACGRGHYRLRDRERTEELSPVKEALRYVEYLEERREEQVDLAKKIDRLRGKVRVLTRQKKAMASKLREIASMCEVS